MDRDEAILGRCIAGGSRSWIRSRTSYLDGDGARSKTLINSFDRHLARCPISRASRRSGYASVPDSTSSRHLIFLLLQSFTSLGEAVVHN